MSKARLVEKLRRPSDALIECFWRNQPSAWESDVEDREAAERFFAALAECLKADE